jgi:hypothetical protein
MFLVPVVNVIEVAVDIAVEFALVIPRERPRCRLVACRKRLFFSTFPYVCPEPVLAKRSHLYTYENGAKKAFSCFPAPSLGEEPDVGREVSMEVTLARAVWKVRRE